MTLDTYVPNIRRRSAAIRPETCTVNRQQHRPHPVSSDRRSFGAPYTSASGLVVDEDYSSWPGRYRRRVIGTTEILKAMSIVSFVNSHTSSVRARNPCQDIHVLNVFCDCGYKYLIEILNLFRAKFCRAAWSQNTRLYASVCEDYE